MAIFNFPNLFQCDYLYVLLLQNHQFFYIIKIGLITAAIFVLYRPLQKLQYLSSGWSKLLETQMIYWAHLTSIKSLEID